MGGFNKMKCNKHKYDLVGMLSLFFIVIFASCKTVPPAITPEEPKFQENLAKDAEKARVLAIEKGADKTYAELFSASDRRLQSAKSTVKTNREEAIKEFGRLVLIYKALANLAEAYKLKTDIDEMGFESLDPDTYRKAEDLYNDALARCRKDGEGAMKASEEALSLYGKLCDAGYAKLIATIKNEAKIAKNNCDAVKASRSMTNEYNEAVRLYNEGSAFEKEKRYRSAYTSYVSARDAFNRTFKATEDKRQEAEEALKKAKAKIMEASSLAKEADVASPLKEGTEGFADVDSSSLENRDSDRQKVEEITD